MKGLSFFDTNILIYTDDPKAASSDKSEMAIELVERAVRNSNGVISTQVMQEYYVAATRKLGVDPELARQRLEFFTLMHTVLINPDDVLDAVSISRLHQVSFWDALIIHSARQASCPYLLSEDMNNGQVIEGVIIVNPFLAEKSFTHILNKAGNTARVGCQ